MKKQVTFVVPQSTWTSKDHLPSLGLACVAAVLERDGFDVSVLDCQALQWSVTDAAKAISNLNSDAVGLTSTSHDRFWAIQLAKEVKKERNPLLLAGGVHFGLTGKDALENVPELDIIVKGEGEVTTGEVLKARFAGDDLSKVQGILYRDGDGRIVENLDRPFIKDLNQMPDPAWHCFDLDRYQAKLEGCRDEGGRAIGIMSSRGCPFRCSFCANEAFWRQRFRRLDPVRFVNQLEYLYTQYGFRDFDLWDDTFTVVESHARAVCEQILKRGLDVRFYLRARVDTVNQELLALIKKAGGVAIGYGIESGSPRILESIAKGITVEQARSTVKMSIDLGFFVKAFFMTSLPGETLEDVAMTMALAKELGAYGGERILVGSGFPTTIYPGTRVESIAKEMKLLPADFSWNRYYEFETTKHFGLNPTLPCFENPDLSLKEILEFRSSGGPGAAQKTFGKNLSGLVRGIRARLRRLFRPPIT